MIGQYFVLPLNFFSTSLMLQSCSLNARGVSHTSSRIFKKSCCKLFLRAKILALFLGLGYRITRISFLKMNNFYYFEFCQVKCGLSY